MPYLQLSKEFENGWLYLRENLLTPYIREPHYHLNNPGTRANKDLRTAQGLITDMIMKQRKYAKEHVEELLNRLLTQVIEYLSAAVLPSLRKFRGKGAKFLKTVGESWTDHEHRTILLTETLFPKLRKALGKYGRSEGYIVACLHACYNDSVYQDLAGEVREVAFGRILDTSERKCFSDSADYIAGMMSAMSSGDPQFLSTEWVHPLLTFAETVLDKKRPSANQDEEFVKFLDFYGWFLCRGLSYYLNDNDSRSTISSFLQNLSPKISKLVEEHRNQILKVMENHRAGEEEEDMDVEVVKGWMKRSPAFTEAVCAIAKSEVGNEWTDISTSYADQLNIRQNKCLKSCVANVPGTPCNCLRPVLHEFVASFLDLWRKFTHTFKLFATNVELKKQIKQEFRNLLDTATGKLLTPKVIVDYYISLLENVTESPVLHDHCTSILEVAELFENTHEFIKDLQRKLASFLAGRSSTCNYACKGLIGEQNGNSASLEGVEIDQMVAETEHWDGENEKFATWIKGKQKSSDKTVQELTKSFAKTWSDPKDFRIATVRSAAWPTEKETLIRMPEAVNTGLSLFERYYEPRYTERTLKWNKSCGRAIVTTSLFSNTGDAIKLSLLLPQFCVLNLFQERDELSVEEVLKLLLPRQCDDEIMMNSEKLVIATLKSLSTTQCPLLKLVAEKVELQKSDKVKLNAGFSSPEELLVVPPFDEFLSEDGSQ